MIAWEHILCFSLQYMYYAITLCWVSEQVTIVVLSGLKKAFLMVSL